MNNQEKNINKVIKELSSKTINSRQYIKYNKILMKKYNDVLRFKKTRTREKSLDCLEIIKNTSNDIILQQIKINGRNVL